MQYANVTSNWEVAQKAPKTAGSTQWAVPLALLHIESGRGSRDGLEQVNDGSRSRVRIAVYYLHEKCVGG